ncbi:hypothetical protein D3C71_2159410 [compost metagenome]
MASTSWNHGFMNSSGTGIQEVKEKWPTIAHSSGKDSTADTIHLFRLRRISSPLRPDVSSLSFLSEAL